MLPGWGAGETRERFFGTRYDYVVDAVDTVSAKLELAVRCQALGVPLISAMGSGNKLDPSAFSVSDLSKTEGCPLARVMRKELRKRGIHHLKVVWSREEPRAPPAPPAADLPPGGGTRPPRRVRPPPPCQRRRIRRMADTAVFFHFFLALFSAPSLSSLRPRIF